MQINNFNIPLSLYPIFFFQRGGGGVLIACRKWPELINDTPFICNIMHITEKFWLPKLKKDLSICFVTLYKDDFSINYTIGSIVFQKNNISKYIFTNSTKKEGVD